MHYAQPTATGCWRCWRRWPIRTGCGSSRHDGRRGRNYVSQLARKIGISRPLLHLHLQKLEEAGLVTSQLELSRDGKALNYFEVDDFGIELTPAAIAEAAKSLTAKIEK